MHWGTVVFYMCDLIKSIPPYDLDLALGEVAQIRIYGVSL